MKKLFYLFTLLIVFGSQIQSQNETKVDTIWVNGVPKVSKRKIGATINEMNPSPLKKDDYLFEVSYGYPFNPVLEAGVYGGFFSGTRTKNITKNTNHLCLRTDFQLNEEFSVGLELTYATITFDYYRHYDTYNSTGTTTVTYKDSLFSASATKIRFLAKMGFHFNISERFDAYGTAGFGVKQFTYASSDSFFNNYNTRSDFPIALRLSIGGRFFLSDNFAIHVEGGVGGPMMQAGVTFKMH